MNTEKEKLNLWSNLKILKAIEKTAREYPDLRFCQLMEVFGFKTWPDRFYEVSYKTYQEIMEMQGKIKKS